MSYITPACTQLCSSVACMKFGCRMARPQTMPTIEQPVLPQLPWPREAIGPAPSVPRGCICPPTSEQTCQSEICPRKAKERL